MSPNWASKWAWVCYNINFLLLFFCQGSLSGPRNIVHCCHPTPEAPLHFQRQGHLCAPMSPRAGVPSGCEVWNACHCFHSCAATTHFHACYWWQKGIKFSVLLLLFCYWFFKKTWVLVWVTLLVLTFGILAAIIDEVEVYWAAASLPSPDFYQWCFNWGSLTSRGLV